MDLWLSQSFNAVSVGSILLLVALGLAFSFGLMNVINMAHGEFIMIGAYTAYVMQRWFLDAFGNAGLDVYFLVALPVAFVVAAVLGVILERTLINRLYGRPLDTLLATWGVALILQQAARSIFGAPNVQVISPPWLNGGITITATLLLPYKRIFIIALAALCLAGVFYYMTRTPAGRRMRAAMQNRSMAGALGVNTQRVDAITFALGSGLAGVAGCALSLIGPVGPALGTYYLVDAFLVVVLGGVGQLLGTVVAAFAIGGLNTFIEYSTTASMAKVIVFVLVIAFLQWRPSGLVRARTR
jgi:urea transport system permease protein